MSRHPVRPQLALCSALLAAIVTPSAIAAGAAATAAPARTLLRAGHVLDVRSGEQAAAQTIVITGDSITAIGATASIPKLEGDTRSTCAA